MFISATSAALCQQEGGNKRGRNTLPTRKNQAAPELRDFHHPAK
jgi:hypothetical protein